MKENLWDGIISGEPYRLVIEDHGSTFLVTIEPLTEGALANFAKGALGFAKNHPLLIGVGVASAAANVRAYTKIKGSVKFHANNTMERSKFQPIVKELEKLGWKVVKAGYTGTGYDWQVVAK